jgi:hypothetical protein
VRASIAKAIQRRVNELFVASERIPHQWECEGDVYRMLKTADYTCELRFMSMSQITMAKLLVTINRFATGEIHKVKMNA